jgi:fatty-acyl-CoA synthase
LSLWAALAHQAQARPQAPALRFEGTTTDYATLLAEIGAAAAGLAALSIGRGDRIAYLGQNHPSQLVQFFAAARLGAMQLPLNWRLAPPELGFILADATPRLLLAAPEMLAVAREVAPPGCAVLDATAPWPAAPAPPAIGTADDPVLLVYTSGTTGQPKGAVLDQRAVLANAANASDAFELTAADRVLTLLPLFHVGGLNIQTTPALLAGAEVVLLPRFDPASCLATCAETQPSLTLLVPAVMQALVAHPGWQAAALGSLRAIGAGSSDVPLPLIEAFHARGIPVQQVYGATETGPIALIQSRAEALAAPGSIGLPPLHGAVRVVDAMGQPLPPGQPGEIQLRGPQIARGYWNAPPFPPGAWFATGDIGHCDAEGRFWFTDRLKQLIISGGENIYPAEVERVLRDAPGVAEGAICGRPDARWGEVPVAVVVPGPGFDADAVLRYFEGRLARFKHPRVVVTVEALPRTALGKVQLEALRGIAACGRG